MPLLRSKHSNPVDIMAFGNNCILTIKRLSQLIFNLFNPIYLDVYQKLGIRLSHQLNVNI